MNGFVSASVGPSSGATPPSSASAASVADASAFDAALPAAQSPRPRARDGQSEAKGEPATATLSGEPAGGEPKPQPGADAAGNEAIAPAAPLFAQNAPAPAQIGLTRSSSDIGVAAPSPAGAPSPVGGAALGGGETGEPALGGEAVTAPKPPPTPGQTAKTEDPLNRQSAPATPTEAKLAAAKANDLTASAGGSPKPDAAVKLQNDRAATAEAKSVPAAGTPLDEAVLADAAVARRHEARTDRRQAATELAAGKPRAAGARATPDQSPATSGGRMDAPQPAVSTTGATTPRAVEPPPSASAQLFAGAEPDGALTSEAEMSVRPEPTARAPSAAPAIDMARPSAAGPRMDADALAQLAHGFARRVQGGATRFELRLDPAELGKIDVKLDIDAEGRARAAIAVERPEALTELQRNARALERALADAGVSLEEDGLSFSLNEGAERGDDDAAGRDDVGGEHGSARDDDRANHADRPSPPPDEAIEVRAGGYAVHRRARLDVQV